MPGRDKVLQGRDGPVIGLRMSIDLHEKLKVEADRLHGKWHAYDAFNFSITAWHLFKDWPKSDPSRSLSRQKRNEQHLPPQMNLALHVLRDLAIGGKHFVLDPPSIANRKVEVVHEGREACHFSYFFHEDMPGVTVGSHYFSIRVLRNISMRYFAWVFDDSVPVRQFPPEIAESIDYCDIANRPGGPSPALWLQGIDATT